MKNSEETGQNVAKRLENLEEHVNTQLATIQKLKDLKEYHESTLSSQQIKNEEIQNKLAS